MARLCELSTALGDDLRFFRMRASESLSRLPVIEVEAVSTRPDIDPEELLGRPATVRITYESGQERFFSGYVVRVSNTGAQGRLAAYRLEVRPWLWFLTRTTDCRIFQSMNVPDIVAKVLEDEQTKRVEFRLSDPGRYKAWEYCVQYRETDFNFVTRLMEQEGLYWFFEYQDGQDTLVIIDHKGKHEPIEWDESVRYLTRAGAQLVGEDLISRFQYHEEIESGEYLLGEYNFKTPRHDMGTARRPEHPSTHARTRFDVFDFPGDYDTHDEGEAYVASRVEEVHSRAKVFSGEGRLRAFHIGRMFRMEDHFHEGHNDKYLLTSTNYEFYDPGFESDGAGPSTYSCSFTAIRARQQFRPQRLAARPVIAGIQSAVVTGPSGAEIHTDEFGRVKVLFHWDRYGGRNENSSCWLRVAFLAAGDGWGFVSIPRMGQEVIVSFMEGDPDRPLVTGVVYNKDNMPPWTLPGAMTQSGMLSRSTLKGAPTNANAFRFEDEKGKEQVWLHAERNQDIEVEKDETHSVGNDRTKTIGHDETVTVHNNRTETVDVDEKVTIGQNRTHIVKGEEFLTVTKSRVHKVDGEHENILIKQNQNIDIGGSQNVEIGTGKAPGSHKLSATGDWTADVTLKFGVKAGVGITLETGSSKLSMDKGGNIVLSGTDITIKTDGGSIHIDKGGNVEIKGTKITLTGTTQVTASAGAGSVDIQSSAVTAKAPMVKLNS